MLHSDEDMVIKVSRDDSDLSGGVDPVVNNLEALDVEVRLKENERMHAYQDAHLN